MLEPGAEQSLVPARAPTCGRDSAEERDAEVTGGVAGNPAGDVRVTFGRRRVGANAAGWDVRYHVGDAEYTWAGAHGGPHAQTRPRGAHKDAKGKDIDLRGQTFMCLPFKADVHKNRRLMRKYHSHMLAVALTPLTERGHTNVVRPDLGFHITVPLHLVPTDLLSDAERAVANESGMEGATEEYWMQGGRTWSHCKELGEEASKCGHAAQSRPLADAGVRRGDELRPGWQQPGKASEGSLWAL